MYKHSFRTLSKRLLKHISREQKKEAANLISNTLFKTDYWKQSQKIAITIPREIELTTYPIIKQAWKENKQVVIPKCYPHEGNLMKFFIFTDELELENVYLDLYEPIERKSEQVTSNEIDLIVVPGLLFDHNGYRIGYGGGYYDRFLIEFNGTKLSIAMEEQIVRSIPYDDYDIPVDYIISNKQIYQCF
ncbi:5-formyltetrahydrofolate cyclo-ligase [Alkalibacillus haloalkaliphilus]|uniref:5-formyltetrahydrofolate cyclo-ligase n=1 Tax=Alkalibacillus haloalkaliphilus TaxID=94136 RepID=UPI002935E5A7|nr:5-formyltetrahydrofolate cyclo-ligase [Alkalibacillus haloalkaliphilus]MDV2580992.1 5-formyltetrahydrofolate cyclo-ligase [Alkalibacillus haloalkaliphilus]